jgi:deoxyribodipyrimidine photolyase
MFSHRSARNSRRPPRYERCSQPQPLLPPLPQFSGDVQHSFLGEPEIPGAKPVVDSRSALPTDSSEAAALQHLQNYIWKSQHLLTYKQTRNGLIGQDYSSKLSGWLSVGTLSPRYVYHEIQKFEQQICANDSTYWLVFELLWRDFFQFLMIKYEGRLFALNGLKNASLPVFYNTAVVGPKPES